MNDYGAQVAAEDVQAWLDLETPDGEELFKGVQARWAHTKQAPDRSPFATIDDPTLDEAQIPAGSTRHVDVVSFANEFGGFRLWTNQSMRVLPDPQFSVDADEFIATLTVRGSNTPRLTLKLRISGTDNRVQASVAD